MTSLTQTTPPVAVLGMHVLLSVGLALTFTPLFTSALGSLRPHLYSHGSATIGTVQQLAGAAGTALFVVLMVTREADLVAAGADEAAALAGGVSTAFVAGAVLAGASIVLAAMIRRPPTEHADAPMAH